jgi:hypothetical protein
MHHRSQRDIPEIRRFAVIANDAVGQHGKWVRADEPEFTIALYANAATAVGMIHER